MKAMKTNIKKVVNSYTIAVASVITAIIVAACGSSSGGGGSSSISNGAAAVYAGNGYSMVLKKDGTVWAFGYNANGQLGLGTTADTSTPTKVIGLGSGVKAVAVSSGDFPHTLALNNDGSLWAFGSNNSGKLGLGNRIDTSTPTRVKSLGNDVKAIAVGFAHSLVLKNDGTLWVFGSNSEGELGLGSSIDSTSTATQAIGDVSNNVQAIATNYKASFVLKTDGSLWAFGTNLDGQLGIGSTPITSKTPIKIDSLGKDVKAVVAGYSYTFVTKKDGSLWAFGNNASGQLGLGNLIPFFTPQTVIGDVSKDVQAVAAGKYHTLVLKNDSSLWAFGKNNVWQLGLGTRESTSTALQVKSFGNEVQAIAAGGSENAQSLVIKKDGSLWAFGGNKLGQLGLGTTADASTPTKVNLP